MILIVSVKCNDSCSTYYNGKIQMGAHYGCVLSNIILPIKLVYQLLTYYNIRIMRYLQLALSQYLISI